MRNLRRNSQISLFFPCLSGKIVEMGSLQTATSTTNILLSQGFLRYDAVEVLRNSDQFMALKTLR